MIISASRRTDIPARFSAWLFNRLDEGYALVRNPMNPRQVSRVDLSPEAVDGLVLWTKNPLPMLDRLDRLSPYPYYFQFTLTPYGRDVEPGLPDKEELAEGFMRLSQLAGRERVIWRYDPILLAPGYDWDFHLRSFDRLAQKLAPYTNKCIFSFLDSYRCMAKAARELGVQYPSADRQIGMARELAEIAGRYGLPLETCAEPLELGQFGIVRARCIDARLLSRISGRYIPAKKAASQRPECGCAESVDIGAYSTCLNRCLYCYANHSGKALAESARLHDPKNPLLVGVPGPLDKLSARGGPGAPGSGQMRIEV